MRSSDHERISEALRAKMQGRAEDLVLPPPVFVAMRGEFLEFDEKSKTLTARFPVLSAQLNPFGTMQGGMIAAAVDNTIGPLSLLVAPASVTRRLEMKYRRAVTSQDGFIRVEAQLAERKKRRLLLKATVLDDRDLEVASANAVHWVVQETEPLR